MRIFAGESSICTQLRARYRHVVGLPTIRNDTKNGHEPMRRWTAPRWMSVGVCVLLCQTCATLADRQRTILPEDYIHDQYDTSHLNDTEAFLERLRPYPPTVLQIGKTAPFVHSMGPIEGHEGENQGIPGYEERLKFARILSPKELGERITQIRRLTEGAKALGAKYVMPYACILTFFADPLPANLPGRKIPEGYTAEGHVALSRVYGQWSLYERWLGPKPPFGPADWVARNSDGTPWFYYGPMKPRYKPFARYTGCYRNPGWRTWMGAVMRNLGHAGYNGVMLDNVGKMRCYCKYCQTAFQRFLRDRYEPDRLRKVLGVDEYEDVRLYRREADHAVVKGNTNVMLTETLEFEIANHVEFLRYLRAQGRTVDPTFSVCGNTGLIWQITGTFAEMDWTLIEGHGWWGTPAALGMTRQRYPGIVRRSDSLDSDRYVTQYGHGADEVIIRNAFNYSVSAIIPGDKRACHMTTRYGHHHDVNQEPSPDNALLAFAEAAAYSGGRGQAKPYRSTPFVRTPWLDAMNWMRKSFFRFVGTHRRCYEGLERRARIGIIFCTRQVYWYGDIASLAGAVRLARFFAEQNIEFELIPEYRFRADELSTYPVVVLAQTAYVSDELLSALVEYVERGGSLLVSAPVATMRTNGEERPSPENSLSHAPVSKPVLTRRKTGRIVFFPPFPVDRQEGVKGWAQSFRFGTNRAPGFWEGSYPGNGVLAALAEVGLIGHHLRAVQSPRPELGIATYASLDSTRLVVHLLNYRVPIGYDHYGEAAPILNCELRIPIPAGHKAAKATLFEPRFPRETNFAVQEDAVEVTAECTPGMATIVVPRVRVYGLLSIELSAAR